MIDSDNASPYRTGMVTAAVSEAATHERAGLQSYARTSVMIDGQESRDLDDAIRVDRIGDGWVATVHVAAVAAIIAEGSATDEQARAAGESKYLSHKVIPMLGGAAERAATLSASEGRQALSVTMTFDTSGERIGTEVDRVWLQAGSCQRVSYQQVPTALVDASHGHHQLLTDIDELAQLLLARRRNSGALAIYDLLRGYAIGEEGAIVAIPAQQRTCGYVMVAEMMIAANAAIAEWCIDRDVPILFRNHRTSLIGESGTDLAADIAAALDDPELFEQLQSRVNRTLGKATYDAAPRGHHGLRLEAYCHATSPLRRYADLVTQRIICDHIAGREHPYPSTALHTLAGEINTAVEKRRQATAVHMKERSRRERVQRILDGNYSALEPKQWRKMFDLMTAVAPSPGIETELVRRLNAGVLAPADLGRMIAAGPAWDNIRRRFYPAVRAQHPEFAPSALSIFATIVEGAVPVEVEESRDPHSEDHRPVFAVRARMGDQIGQWQTAQAKKTAQTQAMWELLLGINGLAALAGPDDQPHWPAPAAAPLAVTEASTLPDDVRQQLDALNPARRNAALGNPVGWLADFAATHHLGVVDYTFTTDGPPHAPVFTCTVGFAGLSHTEAGASKKATKVAAATGLLSSLLTAPGPNQEDEGDASS